MCITGSFAASPIVLNISHRATSIEPWSDDRVAAWVAGVLGTGLQIAAPVLAATLVADVILGFLGKASPQMPLMLLGPALKSMLGVGLLMTVIRYWPALFGRYFTESVGFTERLSASGGEDMSDEQDRKTYTAAPAKGARSGPGCAVS